MTTIRRATMHDLGEIERMGALFYHATEYAALLPMDASTVADVAVYAMGAGLLLVADPDDESGRLEGLCCLLYAPFTFNRHVKMAAEVAWYVDPSVQRNGVGSLLLDAIEAETDADGVNLLQMQLLETSPPWARDAFLRRGYTASGSIFFKEIQPWQP